MQVPFVAARLQSLDPVLGRRLLLQEVEGQPSQPRQVSIGMPPCRFRVKILVLPQFVGKSSGMVLGGREQLILEVMIMLPVTPGSPISIWQVVLAGSTVLLDAEGTGKRAPCLGCGTWSRQVHDRYQRWPLVPWRSSVVRLHLMVRRFRCPNRVCPRATFAEDFGLSLPRFARRTTDATALLLHLACTAGGEVGARQAQRIGLSTSPDTLLRLLRQLLEPDRLTPTVLGVDDLSLRRGRSFAILLVDLVTHQRVDLLEGREAAVLAEGLKRHPGVTTIVRDRSEAYTE